LSTEDEADRRWGASPKYIASEEKSLLDHLPEVLLLSRDISATADSSRGLGILGSPMPPVMRANEIRFLFGSKR
jgi:hypothetical protein